MWKISNSVETYSIDRWGSGYFDINRRGHILVRPHPEEFKEIDIMHVISELGKKGMQPPVILRFPQIIEDRIKKINEAFTKSINEFNYPSQYNLIYPMKVNQRKEIVTEIARVGKKYSVGMEVGSKPELMAALTLETEKDSLLICNGYKDVNYLTMAMNGNLMGKDVIIVVDELGELPIIIKLAKELGIRPVLGLRVKLYSKGSGKWAESGGEASKYGLTSYEIMEAMEQLRKAKMLDRLKLLHFHIGSQITEIRRVQKAVQEAARMYCKIKKLGVDIDYFNVGGGLGVDYDGSKTSSSASANYNLQEYANNVVYQVQYICEDEDVEPPRLLSESGRSVVAYHAILIIDVMERIPHYQSSAKLKLKGDEPAIIEELYNTWKELNVKNYGEYFHDAMTYKDELITLFNLGQIDLEDKAKGERLYIEIMKKVSSFVNQTKETPEDFEKVYKMISQKFICNFSIFQSMPDHWAIKQLFPIMPVHRLNQEPTEFGTLADITCDSDGKVSSFVDIRDVKDVLELHPLVKGKPYYLGAFLVGAYQDTIGDFHNLLGTVDEAYIIVGERGDWHIKKKVTGDTVADVLAHVRFDRKKIEKNITAKVNASASSKKISKAKAKRINDSIIDVLDDTTYINE